MGMFLPAGFLVEAIRESAKIGEYLKEEIGRLERWGGQPRRDQYEQWLAAVDKLLWCTSQAEMMTARLSCEPIIFMGAEETGEVLRRLDQLWPGAGVDPSAGDGVN